MALPTPTIRNPGPGISRIDHAGSRTFGFFVRIGYQRTPRGTRPRHTAFFGDVTHGGKRAALKAAVRWANRVRREVAREAKQPAAAPPRRIAKRTSPTAARRRKR